MESLRMCVCCRQMKDKKSLLRIVKSKDGEISIDETGKKNGRGAYMCRNEDCLKLLIKNKCLNKAFKTNIPPETIEMIKEAIGGQN